MAHASDVPKGSLKFHYVEGPGAFGTFVVTADSFQAVLYNDNATVIYKGPVRKPRA